MQTSPSLIRRLFLATGKEQVIWSQLDEQLKGAQGSKGYYMPTFVHLNFTFIYVITAEDNQDGVFTLLSSNDDGITSEKRQCLHCSRVESGN